MLFQFSATSLDMIYYSLRITSAGLSPFQWSALVSKSHLPFTVYKKFFIRMLLVCRESKVLKARRE